MSFPVARLRIGWALVLVWSCLNLANFALAQEPNAMATKLALDQFENSVKPLLQQHCFQCHGPDEQESDLRIDVLDPNLIEGQHGGKWREVLDALNRGDMPPEDESQPSAEQRDTIINWMTTELNRAAIQRRSTGGHVTLRRLTRYEYHNTMRDLLGIEMDYSKDLPPDTKGIDGYKNNGVFLGMSELQLEEYYNAAKKGLAAAIVSGAAVKPIHQTVTKSSSGVRFDALATAPYDEELGATVVGYGRSNPKQKKGGVKKTAMLLLCRDKLPLTGTFRVRIEASSTDGDPQFSPPRMLVEIGHKTGVKVEPSKVLGAGDVTAKPNSPQVFEFTGRLEEFPLHIGDTIKKFPGLRVIITDVNAVPPKSPPKRKGATEDKLTAVETRPALVIHSVEFQTPVDLAWPPASHTRILPPRASGEADDVYVRSVLEDFISRAYRRPATEQEIDWASRYYTKTRPTTGAFEEAIREVLALVLMSPKFLYIPEYQAKGNGNKKVSLSDYELANRLSYFLWGTMPDEELQSLARSGRLSDDGTLAKQVERMISDERSWEFVNGFASQWQGLDGVDAVAVNPEFFPDFDNELKQDMKQESLHFFAEILYKKMSCLNLLESEFVVVNDRLAEFYGIEKPKSGDFQKVALPADSIRGGVLTQASFLLSNSTGAQSHPVYRAKWFLDRIMGDPPGDPPADVPELDEKKASAKKLTIREQLEEHRTRASCNRCHRNLDPWGIPFEGFNAIGQYVGAGSKSGAKTTAKSKTGEIIAEDSVLPDGTEVNGSKQLIAYLLKSKKEKFAEGFSKHLLTYALGRSLEWTDQPFVDQLSSEFQASGYRMDQLISKIVRSDAFKTK